MPSERFRERRDRLEERLQRLFLAVSILIGLARFARHNKARACPNLDGLAPLPGGAGKSLDVYRQSAVMLRDIHSLKLSRARKWADQLRFWLIALSTTATCIGFIGVADIAKDVGLKTGIVNFTTNVVLLLLLLVVIAELAWRQGDRASEHQRAIVVLTSFIRDLENRLRHPVSADDLDLVERFGERHELIIQILPPHTDNDYLNAKRADAEKTYAKAEIKMSLKRRIDRLNGRRDRRLRRLFRSG